MACHDFFVVWPPGALVTTWKLEPSSPLSIREEAPSWFLHFLCFVPAPHTLVQETEQWKRLLLRCTQMGAMWQFGGGTRYFWFKPLTLFCWKISFSPCISYEQLDWSLFQPIPHHFFLFLSFVWNSKSLFHLGSQNDIEQSGRRSGPFAIVHFIFMLSFYLAFLNSFEMNFLSALLWPCESKELSY